MGESRALARLACARLYADTAAATLAARTGESAWDTLCVCPVRQPEAGHCRSHQAKAEFLERLAARYGLRQSFGQFIEFVVHRFLLSIGCSLFLLVPLVHQARRLRRSDQYGEIFCWNRTWLV
jgi:hypothetical protein